MRRSYSPPPPPYPKGEVTSSQIEKIRKQFVGAFGIRNGCKQSDEDMDRGQPFFLLGWVELPSELPLAFVVPRDGSGWIEIRSPGEKVLIHFDGKSWDEIVAFVDSQY